MRIAVDVDGVLADCHTNILRELGIGGGLDVLKTWESLVEIVKARNLDFYDVYRRVWLEYWDIHVTDFTVIPAMFFLKKNGHVVDVVTARPEDLGYFTERWLEMCNIEYDDLVIVEPTWDVDGKIELGYDLYVDDNPYLALRIPDRVIVYDRPWNRMVKGVRRARIFNDVLEYLGEFVI